MSKVAKDNLLWIDISDRDAAKLKRVGDLLDLRPDVWAADRTRRPQLENYGDYFRFSVATAPTSHNHDDEGDRPHPPDLSGGFPGSTTLDFIVSQRWLVTVHEGGASFLQRFRDQDKSETLIGLLTGQALAASLLDWHLGEFFHEVSSIEEAVDNLDERVLRESTSRSLL